MAARAAEVYPLGQPTIERLLSPGFDARRQVIVERQAFSNAQMRSATLGLSEIAGHARIIRRQATSVEIQVDAGDDGYLVLTDSYDPDWRATVDGRPAELTRGNQMFRAVPVPRGTHRVVFTYRPAPLLCGALLTLASVIFAAALIFAEMRNARKHRAAVA